MTLLAGRYRIDALLGAGGMGEVHRGYDVLLQRVVAIKVLLAGTDNALALREARAAAKVSHANVVAVHDAGEHEGRAFVVMELVEGRSLRGLLGAAAPLADRIAWLAQIADGLAAAHEANLVHRDVKPDNVIVRAADHAAKLLDFGIARRLPTSEPRTHATDEGRVSGTPAYMSPEQIAGGAPDARTDQFAWGVTAYEVLTGELPWGDATSLPAVLKAILMDEPAPPSARAPVPSALDAIVLCALAKKPEGRFPRMRDLRAALDAPSARGEADDARAPTVRAIALPSLPPPSLARVTILDAPLPASDAPEALDAYQGGLRALHDASTEEAERRLLRAVELDPKLGAAWLRLALVSVGVAPTRTLGVERFRRASDLRRSLSGRDRALLHAWSTVFLPGGHDIREKARELAERLPNDAEALFFASRLSWRTKDAGDEPAAIVRRAIEIDPDAAVAHWWLAVCLGRASMEEAGRALDRAIALSPTSTDARHDRAFLNAQLGRADEVTHDARAILALGKGAFWTHELLAGSVYARTRDVTSTAAVLRRAAPAFEEGFMGAEASPHIEARLALLRGDLDAAIDTLRAALARAPGPRFDARSALVRLLVDALVEKGAIRDAAELAMTWLDEAETLAGPLPVRFDPAPACLAAAEVGGLIGADRAEAARAAWLAAPMLVEPFMAWGLAYAPLLAHGRGRERALAALPAARHNEGYYVPNARMSVGEALFDVGLHEEAAGALRVAAATCLAPNDPLGHVRSIAYLGHARAALGDARGAIEAYARVDEAWGRAEPPMRSVARAQAERARLVGRS